MILLIQFLNKVKKIDAINEEVGIRAFVWDMLKTGLAFNPSPKEGLVSMQSPFGELRGMRSILLPLLQCKL